MRRFARLFDTLDRTTRTNAKVAALAEYLTGAPEEDRLWAIALLSGRRPRRVVASARLRDWAAERAGLPLWLVEESYPVVGDLAETIALILPPPLRGEDRSLAEWMDWLAALRPQPEAAHKAAVLEAWDGMAAQDRLVFNKLLTGGFRVGVSAGLVTRALSQATGIEAPKLAHRLMGDWTPATTSWDRLILSEDPADDLSRPYPFCLAHPLEDPAADLGAPGDWLAEWKWDGIRGQAIRRGGELYLWSRGEDLITPRFPDLAPLADFLPDGTVIDGEILAWDRAADRPLAFARLQTRLGRKTVPKKLLAEAPARLLAYDLLEQEGTDLRPLPLEERRLRLDRLLQQLPAEAPLAASPLMEFGTWDELGAQRAAARSHHAEGLMLKHRASPYHAGRRRGDWWKWKLEPLRIDAVLLYAQAGHGRRATLFTDFTFAVWDGPELVPFAKAYSGLTDAEFAEITAWVRRNTRDRFGPVRQVAPQHVFEIAFEGIRESPRHKSGIALRFPRMARWRRDKAAAEASTLTELRALLDLYG
ncbi:ATP-dependent DNA ligase [Mangrovicoccus algicola]|uniref:DNA ligase (ATP) n=1 Tax=Mangrovicoccus algicola TaxID=2771008 RepID=A0A8J6Z5E7_9RHOB|nr:ATP-dependent DNA ligase [Mangrovicoccus algicola]MBE3638034.1 ATP-dependent DNA ligase [Mangrovicoccus algicola]